MQCAVCNRPMTLEERGPELERYRCPRCGRIGLRYRSDLTVALAGEPNDDYFPYC